MRRGPQTILALTACHKPVSPRLQQFLSSRSGQVQRSINLQLKDHHAHVIHSSPGKEIVIDIELVEIESGTHIPIDWVVAAHTTFKPHGGTRNAPAAVVCNTNETVCRHKRIGKTRDIADIRVGISGDMQ